MVKYIGYWIGLLLMLGSCNNSMTVDEMRAYVQQKENGLFVEKNINGIDLSAMYQPSQLLAIRERDSDREKYNHYLYFVLSMSANGEELLSQISNRVRYSKLVSTLSFELQNHTRLITSEGTEMQLLDVHYVPTYGAGAANQVMLVFKKEKLENTKWVKLELKDIGLKTGDTSFKFNTKDLLKVPDLKI